VKCFLLFAALLPLAARAEVNRETGYPAPPPGAPTAACSLDDVPSTAPVRIVRGNGPVPYAFACAQHGTDKPCIGGNVNPGVIVTVAASSGEWSCVSGGDSTSGWVPTSSLAELPTAPKVPLQQWIGWWHNRPDTPSAKSDRLLITRGSLPGSLRVSGRAYWYGLNGNVHFGQLSPTEAKPSGPYLHLVEGDTLSGCVLDLHFDPARHTLHSYDNSNCGGMNVRFSGTWIRFTPKARHFQKPLRNSLVKPPKLPISP